MDTIMICYRLLIYCIFANWFNVSADDMLGETVRLVNGSSNGEGRVELYHIGEWGTLCNDYFGINEAYVICRQLGFFSVKKTVSNRRFVAGHGPIHLIQLNCTGLEEDILECEYTDVLNTDCTHEQDAGVRCIEEIEDTGSSYKPIRLVDGRRHYEGSVEILHNGEWSSICDDKWDIKDARVACRQLGYTTAISSVSRAKFGHGKGMILFDNTACTGYEKYLNECPHSEFGAHDCSHGEEAGVVCDHLTEIKDLKTEQNPLVDYDPDDVDYILQPMLMSDSYLYSYDFQSDLRVESKSCMTDKCQNDAACVPLHNSTNFCICIYPWSGNNCEITGLSILYPPYKVKTSDEEGKWTVIFQDINTYIVFGGFSFLLILSVFILYAISDIRTRRRELRQNKTPNHPAYV